MAALTTVVSPDAQGLRRAAGVLREGGLVALPTETFYGLAAALDQPEALARLSLLKERLASSPLPLLVLGLEGPGGLAAVAAALPGRARLLIERFWPGPLTLVLPAREGLPPEVVGPDGTVGVRWSPEPVVAAVLGELGVPITATSANLRGEPPPRRADEVLRSLGGEIDLLVQGPPLAGGMPSTVLRPEADGRLTLLRAGRLPLPLLADPDGLSLDALRRGRVRFLQPRRRGLRVNIDPVLLAWFLEGRVGEGLVVDLGTGTGILVLLLASMGIAGPFAAVELQPQLAELARENALLNGLDEGRCQVIEADLRRPERLAGLAGRAAWVVANPPWNRPGRGVPSPETRRALARHELQCALPQLVAAAAELLRPGGRCALIQRADREEETLAALAAAGLAPRRLKRVRSYPDRPCIRVLVEAVRAEQAELVREEDLVLHQPDTTYCPEIRQWLEGG